MVIFVFEYRDETHGNTKSLDKNNCYHFAAAIYTPTRVWKKIITNFYLCLPFFMIRFYFLYVNNSLHTLHSLINMDQLNDDLRLLNFDTYEDYLDSLVTVEDLHYLCSTTVARTIVQLGYRWVVSHNLIFSILVEIFRLLIFFIINNILLITIRTTKKTYDREQFEFRKAAIQEQVNPSHKTHTLMSDGFSFDEPLMEALALRERPNRVGNMTVSFCLFVIQCTKN